MTRRTLTDITINGTRFTAHAVPTHTKRHGHHIRLEHRINGRTVSPEAWLDASYAADREGHERAYGPRTEQN